jgi:hypothetical protein
MEALKGEQLERDRRKWMEYYEPQITSLKMEVKNLIEAQNLKDTAFANEKDILIQTAEKRRSNLERDFKENVHNLSNELVKARAKIMVLLFNCDWELSVGNPKDRR